MTSTWTRKRICGLTTGDRELNVLTTQIYSAKEQEKEDMEAAEKMVEDLLDAIREIA